MKYLLFLLPLIPLAFLPPKLNIMLLDSIRPYATIKILLFRAILTPMLIPIWYMAVKKKILPPKEMLLFLGAILLTAFLGADPHRSIIGNSVRGDGFMTIFLFASLYLGSRIFFQRKDFITFTKISVACSTLICLDVIISQIGLPVPFTTRAHYSTFGNVIYLAQYVMIHLFILVNAWIKKHDDRKMLFFLIIFHIIVLYVESSRAMWIGTGFGVLYLIYKFFQKRYFYLSVFLTLGSGIYLILSKTRYTWSYLINDHRFKIWLQAIKGIKIHPTFGWGMDNFIMIPGNHDILPGVVQVVDKAHNMFLEWFVSGGIVLFSAYMIFMFYVWRKVRGYGNHTFMALFIAYLIQNIFFFDTLFSYGYLFMMLAFIEQQSNE